jgi:anti-anti-sigma regulatory factor
MVAGLELGQRCLYVGDGPHDALLAELPPVLALDVALGSGALTVMSSSEVYDVTAPTDAASQLAVYAATVNRAVADGFAGLRVVADITPLVVDPARRPAHLQWEQVADRYMTDHPWAPLCLYDARRVAGLDSVMCVHPLQGVDNPTFTLYGVGPDRAALAGDLDGSVWDAAEEALDALPDTDESLDLSALTFADGPGVSILYAALQRRHDARRPLRLTGATRQFRKVWELCGYDPSLLEAA